MNKIFTAAAAMLIAGVATIESADAQNYQRQGYGQRGGYNQTYRGGYNNNSYYRNNGNRYVQNNYYGKNGNGNAWAAGAIGLGVGALLGAAIAQPAYAAPAYGYPAYGYAPAPAPVYVPTCWREPVFNPAGQQVGWQQVCQ